MTGNQPGMGLAQTSASAVLAHQLGIWPGTIPQPPLAVSIYFAAFDETGNIADLTDLPSAHYAEGE